MISAERLLARLAQSTIGRELLSEAETERETEHERLTREFAEAEAQFLRQYPTAVKARDAAIASQETLRAKLLEADEKVMQSEMACSALRDTCGERKRLLEPRLREFAHPEVLAWPGELTRRLDASGVLIQFRAEHTVNGLRETFNNRPQVEAYQRRIAAVCDAADALASISTEAALKAIAEHRRELDAVEAAIPHV